MAARAAPEHPVCISGVFGNWVQVTEGRRKYARAPEGDNFPLSMWSNRWSTMPIHVAGINGLPRPDARAWLDKAYFFPIMRDEMNKNSLLIQNPGY